ncbi:hypothetical protein [Arthrobacter sp. JSM 101049]|uniref:hypothetical protein n=1 Tax=Arthrobacter sp. JSM 101049 TaxID=929097 RepID=UPI0035660A0B
MAYEIDKGQLHAVLIDVAADGQSLQLAAQDARTAGDDAARRFGSAGTVSAAFSRFWAPRDDVGLRAASLVFRKAESLSQAAVALIEADGRMTDSATAALRRIPASFAPTAARRPGPQPE